MLCDADVWDAYCTASPAAALSYKASGYAQFGPDRGYFHRWVADNFLESPSDSRRNTVDHVNRDRLDNRLCNLRYATQTEQNINQSIRNRAPGVCPVLWEGFDQLPTGVNYVPAAEHAEHFEFQIKEGGASTRQKSSKDRDVLLIQKYEEVLKKLKPLEARADRLAVIEDHLARCTGILDEVGRVTPKKSGVARKSSRDVVVDGEELTIVRFDTADNSKTPSFEILVDRAHKDLAMRANAELRVDRVQLSHRIAEHALGRRLIARQGLDPGENAFHRNGVKQDYRAANLVVKREGPAAKQTVAPDDPVVLNLLQSFDQAMGRGAVHARDEDDTAVEDDSPPPSRPRTDATDATGGNPQAAHVLHPAPHPKDPTNVIPVIYDAADADAIKQAGFTRDNNVVVVTLRMINKQFKPFVRNNPRYLAIAKQLDKNKVNLATFVYRFVHDKEVPEGFCVKGINNFDSDVRMDNLVLKRGSGKSKSVDATIVPKPLQDMGITLLPYRVRASDQDGRITVYAIVDDDPQKKNNREWSRYTRVYTDAVEEAKRKLRRSIPEYDELDARYQRMYTSRLNIIAK